MEITPYATPARSAAVFHRYPGNTVAARCGHADSLGAKTLMTTDPIGMTMSVASATANQPSFPGRPTETRRAIPEMAWDDEYDVILRRASLAGAALLALPFYRGLATALDHVDAADIIGPWTELSRTSRRCSICAGSHKAMAALPCSTSSFSRSGAARSRACSAPRAAARHRRCARLPDSSR